MPLILPKNDIGFQYYKMLGLCNIPYDKSGRRSPALPDELMIKRAAQLSVSVAIQSKFIPYLCVGESGSLGSTFTYLSVGDIVKHTQNIS